MFSHTLCQEWASGWSGDSPDKASSELIHHLWACSREHPRHLTLLAPCRLCCSNFKLEVTHLVWLGTICPRAEATWCWLLFSKSRACAVLFMHVYFNGLSITSLSESGASQLKELPWSYQREEQFPSCCEPGDGLHCCDPLIVLSVVKGRHVISASLSMMS